MAVTYTCQFCGGLGSARRLSDAKVRKFCGRDCANRARRKSEQKSKYLPGYSPASHPLAPAGGKVKLHRLIVWDAIGPGSHPCYHCGETVTWMPGAGCIVGALVVDHLDRNTRNNAPENLVPSCPRCNVLNQAKTVLDDEGYNLRPTGRRLRGKRRSCATCGTSFVAWPQDGDGRKRVGIYCSRKCMLKRNPPPPTRTCQRCGKEFVRPYVKEAKYCSPACYQSTPKARPKPPNRSCLQCGGAFWSPSWREKKYCGHRCYDAARAASAKSKAS